MGLETQRELEDLVISAIYAGLVSGTLDPYHRVVCLSSVSPLRDLPPASIPSMLRTMDAWSSRCVSTLAELEKQIESVKAEALKRKESINREREELDKATSLEKQGEGKTLDKSGQGDLFAHLTRKLGAGAASKRGNGGLDREDSDDMDLDDDDDDFVEPKESRAAKKRTFFGKS